MKILLTTAMLLFSLSATAAPKQNPDTTAVFTVQPQMSCQNCENKIKSNMRFEKGVKNIETSLDKQTVTITFNKNRSTIDALVKGFSKIGYKATELKAGVQPAAKKSDSDQESCCKIGN